MKHLKHSDETNIEYQIRLYRNKDSYGLSNFQIGELLNEVNGVDYDESKWRKYSFAYIDGYDDCISKQINIDDEISRLRLEREELYKAKVKVQDANREYRSSLRKDARYENLIDSIQDNAKELALMKPLNIGKWVGETDEKTGILLLSDWHYGDVIHDFVNQFDTDIFIKRLETLIEETRSICVKESFEKLIILNLGDLVSGNIHVSTRVNNEVDIITQVQKVSEYIAQLIQEVLPTVPEIEFYSVADNHSRMTPNKPANIEEENFGRIIHWYLQARFADVDNVKILSNKVHGFDDFDIGMFDVYGEKIIFSHGHNDKISSIVPDLSMMLKVIPMSIMTAHLHRNYEEEEHEVDLIMNPSLCGTNKYAKSIRKSSKPRQKLITYKKEKGKVKRDCTYLIDLR